MGDKETAVMDTSAVSVKGCEQPAHSHKAEEAGGLSDEGEGVHSGRLFRELERQHGAGRAALAIATAADGLDCQGLAVISVVVVASLRTAIDALLIARSRKLTVADRALYGCVCSGSTVVLESGGLAFRAEAQALAHIANELDSATVARTQHLCVLLRSFGRGQRAFDFAQRGQSGIGNLPVHELGEP